ncbi:MAG: radical SAM protein [Candidatus Eisenbacteria bacterium]|uniref:Radical SAM protein n=1 Tax=Eiseniibacteriota bacterium TaxID=2212470 RepID=A0A538U4U2_UNCEI|nr:MAG: radical SAM protein [Candidatus Eisenbacteria bacterium]
MNPRPKGSPGAVAGAREGPGPRARAEARLGLYVHVPFCAVRCSYCDFSSGSLSAAAVTRYLAGVAREAERRAPEASGVAFSSVFFGGGTPSALSARHFRALWDRLRANFAIARGAEITLEANPETVGPALLDAWAAAGINRLSMGAQSFDPEELARLGRIWPSPGPTASAASRST